MAEDPHARLGALVDEALLEIGERSTSNMQAPAKPLPTLLEQCRALTAESARLRAPIRIVDHFACTGGTLISKCIAALPNVRLLSEIEPHSGLVLNPQAPRFSPTDLVQHIQTNVRGGSAELAERIFLAGLREIYDWYRLEGADLVLRGHAHSVYCSPLQRPRALRELVMEHYGCLSLVTVRHPMESYLSVLEKNWIKYEPAGLDAYCQRYIAFLDAAGDPAPLHYEDFVDDPEAGLAQVCNRLDLPFEPVVLDVFNLVRLTGDSGRSGGVIEARPRKTPPPAILEEAQSSSAYTALLERLNYEA